MLACYLLSSLTRAVVVIALVAVFPPLADCGDLRQAAAAVAVDALSGVATSLQSVECATSTAIHGNGGRAVECAHGICVGGRCFCEPGYTGQSCSVATCERGCSSHGYCHRGACVCQLGWTGEHCVSSGCYQNCSGHGECLPRRNSTGAAELCFCDPAWKGLYCQNKVCPLGRNGLECAGKGRCAHGTCFFDGSSKSSGDSQGAESSVAVSAPGSGEGTNGVSSIRAHGGSGSGTNSTSIGPTTHSDSGRSTGDSHNGTAGTGGSSNNGGRQDTRVHSDGNTNSSNNVGTRVDTTVGPAILPTVLCRSDETCPLKQVCVDGKCVEYQCHNGCGRSQMDGICIRNACACAPGREGRGCAAEVSGGDDEEKRKHWCEETFCPAFCRNRHHDALRLCTEGCSASCPLKDVQTFLGMSSADRNATLSAQTVCVVFEPLRALVTRVVGSCAHPSRMLCFGGLAALPACHEH